MDKKLVLLSVLFLVGMVTISTVLAKPDPRAIKACRDGIDNDGDGYTDWPSDPGCSSKNDKTETDPNVECDDGADNDGDSATDLNDNGCSSPTDNDETDCGDGVCEGGEISGTCPADCGYPDSCSDTDGGNYPATYGTTSGYYNDNPYSNNDYCVDSSNVMEYYCSGDYEQSQQQSCGTDSYGADYCTGDSIYADYTDYYCSSGACDSDVTPELQEDCNDSDGYSSTYCVGDLVRHDYYDYFCSIGLCDYTTTPSTVEDCDSYDYYGTPYCIGQNVTRDVTDFYCSSGACGNWTYIENLETCFGNTTCVGGACV